jgi:aryl carrier-like protein
MTATAPLSQRAGTLISKHTRVICNLGATETACLQRLAPSVDDWPYFYWHPTHSGIEMRETEDGLYELFIVRDPKLRLYQGVFNTFPDIQEWSMQDLYSRHPDPSKPFLYRYQCRRDDVIVLSNGEKIAPALIEATLMSHPLVKGAMVVGRGKFQPAALIDLFDGAPSEPNERRQMIERLAPVITEANIHAPTHAKLDQYHVMFADPAKPIKYLGQGKIQRHSTYKLYEGDIEALYRAADEASEQFGSCTLPRLDFSRRESIAGWLELLIAEVTDISIADRDRNLFTSGVDSLQVMRMTRELRSQGRTGLGERSVDMFSSALIYSYPTVDQLADYIFDRTTARTLPNGSSDGHSSLDSTTQPIQALLDGLTGSLPRSSGLWPLPSTQSMAVILTGSTGSLGSYLLNALCRAENVARVICLNRSVDAAKKQAILAQQRGLDPIDEARVEFLQADLSLPEFGLQSPVYTRLLQSATHIIRKRSLLKQFLF